MVEDQRFDDADKAFRHLLGIVPQQEQKNIREQLQLLQERRQEHARQMRDICKKMF